VRSGVDLVLASGGDGTITACVGGIAGTGVPLGVLPCGTGNLLARNLGLPLSLDEALAVALTGSNRRLDVGTANGAPFVVMAGIGFDAEMLDGADERLKSRVGWAAYVLSALRHLRERPVRMTLRADGGPPQRRWASGVVVGNVGSLQGNVRLLPDAVPDDGVLDVAVLAASGWTGWLRLAADVLLRRKTGRVAHLTCRELTVQASRAMGSGRGGGRNHAPAQGHPGAGPPAGARSGRLVSVRDQLVGHLLSVAGQIPGAQTRRQRASHKP
jgi:YegS/Rv2252/BmrU family lipid kinase